MKVLITGANGQVGWELSKQARVKEIEIHAHDRHELDITDAKAVSMAVRNVVPDVVINAAAYTAVDKAEEEVDLAFAVNRDGTAYLASACLEAGIPLLHMSTDYVFDGSNKKAYAENDLAQPLGVYGQSKWDGEQAIRNTLEHYIILRTSWVFGSHGDNFVKTMLRLGRERDELRVVSDQRGCPTSATDIAGMLLDIVSQLGLQSSQAWGTYHFCNSGVTTWYDFAQVIFSEAEELKLLKTPLLVPISTLEYPTPAKRPENSVLDCGKIERTFNITRRPWQVALRETLSEITYD